MKTNRTEKRISPNLEPAARKTADTALLSQKALAREWLKLKEDRARDYL